MAGQVEDSCLGKTETVENEQILVTVKSYIKLISQKAVDLNNSMARIHMVTILILVGFVAKHLTSLHQRELKTTRS
jgi:hypothetical protein